VKDAFDFGMEMGQVFWFVFYPQKVYIEAVLDDGGEFASDWTWDKTIK
jgi:hypothetical protein